MIPPEPPIDEPEPTGGYCAGCDGWPCQCDQAYETYRDLEDL